MIIFKLSYKKKGGTAVYEIDFYADRKGNVPVREYIKKLAGKKDKDSRIKLKKSAII